MRQVMLWMLCLLVWNGFAGSHDETATHQRKTRTYRVQMGYDGRGNMNAFSHPNTGKVQTCTYNSLTGNKTVSYGGQAVVSNTEYTNFGAVKKLYLAPYGDLSGGTIERDYDNLGRLTELKVDIDGNRVYHMRQISYNEWGFIGSCRRDDQGLRATITYGYGSRGELDSYSISGVGTVTYDYDGYGNLKSHDGLDAGGLYLPAMSPVSWNSKNQLGGWTYDRDGKLLEDDHFRYHYNDLERVRRIDDLTTGWQVAHYLYDGFGNRTREIVEDTITWSIRIPDGRLISQEARKSRVGGGQDATFRDFIYHNGQVLATITQHPDGRETRTYHIRDRLNHVAVTLDEESGFAPRYREYSPYGYQMISGPTEPAVVHEFTGHERDEATGWDYMMARYYTPEYGRFNRPDPGFDFNPINPYSFNLYGYTHNNPVNYHDPTGKGLISLAGKILWQGANKGWDLYAFHSLIEDAKANMTEASDPTVPFHKRALAAGMTASEILPVSGNDARTAYKTLKGKLGKKAPNPNKGTSKPHGSPDHDEAINNHIDNLPEGMEDIRKNQVQVDVNGYVVGNNRPDLQFNHDEIHYNIEYDKMLVTAKPTEKLFELTIRIASLSYTCWIRRKNERD